MLGGGDGLSPRHHRPSRQQLVDLVEDFSELRPRVAGDLTDGDGGGFLELQLQLLCLREETSWFTSQLNDHLGENKSVDNLYNLCLRHTAVVIE